jgi:hypothetical protein
LSQKWILWHARPGGSLGLLDGQLLKAILEFLQGHPDARCFHPDGGHPDVNTCHPDSQFVSFFVSFPTTSISSQSDI